MDVLSEEQRAVLVRYYQHVELDPAQRDRLAAKYWEASKPARKEIALVYHKLFTDGDFVNRLLAQHDRARTGTVSPASPEAPAETSGFPTVVSSAATSSPVPAGAPDEATAATAENACASAPSTMHAEEELRPPPPLSAVNSSPPPPPSSHAPRRTHTQMLLRTAIQDRFPKLTTDGPFTLSFEVVESEAQRRLITDLYASQFECPDPIEIQRLVMLPPCSTRTRRRTNGSYTWYLRCQNTAEAVCAVTVTSHHYNSHRFVEMPLFATAAGYKGNGFGRLLNAALRAWCRTAEIEFIMISADRKAIPFWRHLGYELMSRQEKNGIAFYYDHECYTFTDAEPMICYCESHTRKRPRGVSSSPIVRETEVDQVIKHMSRFVIAGAAELPTP